MGLFELIFISFLIRIDSSNDILHSIVSLPLVGLRVIFCLSYVTVYNTFKTTSMSFIDLFGRGNNLNIFIYYKKLYYILYYSKYV